MIEKSKYIRVLFWYFTYGRYRGKWRLEPKDWGPKRGFWMILKPLEYHVLKDSTYNHNMKG